MTLAMNGMRAFRAAVLVGAALALAGCNSKKPADQQPAAQAAGQVIAKVGEQDVTIHELQNEYRLNGVTPDKVNDDVTRVMLREIVKRKALAQRAQQSGLDREPTVLLDLLRSREEVLARALLQRDIQTKVSGLGKTDLERYINANPDHFAKRHRFDVEQVSVNLATINQAFLDAVKDAKNLDEIEAKANEMKIPYTRGAGTVFTGEMPADLVQRLRNRKDTDIFLIRNGPAGLFVKVKADAPDPLGGEQAQQRAQILMRGEAARDEIAKEAGAAITYLGTYKELMEKAAATGQAPAAPASGQTPATPAAPAAQQPAK